MPAALLVLLAAFAGVFGVPATVAEGAVAPGASDSGRAAAREPSRPVKWTGHRVRLAVPTRSTSMVGAAASSVLDGLDDGAAAMRSGPGPAAAVPAAVLLLALAVIGRVAGGGAGWALRRRTPGSLRGRAPPAYALA